MYNKGEELSILYATKYIMLNREDLYDAIKGANNILIKELLNALYLTN